MLVTDHGESMLHVEAQGSLVTAIDEYIQTAAASSPASSLDCLEQLAAAAEALILWTHCQHINPIPFSLTDHVDESAANPAAISNHVGNATA